MKRNEVFIVAGGPSLIGFDFTCLRNKDTIVVNKSIFDVPTPDYFITVDYTFLRKIRSKKAVFDSITPTKIFVADFHCKYLREKKGRIVDIRTNLVYELHDFDVIIKAKQIAGIGYTYNDFRTGTNSGYCALQLAVLLGYTEIYLLGVDLTQTETTHYHGGYGERPSSFNAKIPLYANRFKTGLVQIKQDNAGIEVISCSSISVLNKVIPYQDIKEIL